MRIKSLKQSIIYSMLLLFSTITMYGQATTNGSYNTDGVLISPDETQGTQPDESAILEVRATDQGMLFPSMTHAERLAMPVNSLADGLMIFVTDISGTLKNGFWVYVKSTGWRNMEDDYPPYMKMPNGGIMMYAGSLMDGQGVKLFDASGLGKLGTDVEGWAICNGNNGTPDLQGRFVEGADFASNYNDYRDKGGKDNTTAMSIDQLPIHEHKIDIVEVAATHKHPISNGGHSHYLYRSEGENVKGSQFVKVKGPKQLNNEQDNPDDWFDYKSETAVLAKDQRITKSTKVENTFVIPNDIYGDTPQSAAQPLDNRPSYYVVLYIMKVQYDYINKCFKNFGK